MKDKSTIYLDDNLFSINKLSFSEFLVVPFGVPLILRDIHLMLIHLSISGIGTLRRRAVPFCLIKAKWISPNMRPRLNIARVSCRLTKLLYPFSRKFDLVSSAVKIRKSRKVLHHILSYRSSLRVHRDEHISLYNKL